jgi:potassium voltage-gated channel Eag-related subfamily H protein 7
MSRAVISAARAARMQNMIADANESRRNSLNDPEAVQIGREQELKEEAGFIRTADPDAVQFGEVETSLDINEGGASSPPVHTAGKFASHKTRKFVEDLEERLSNLNGQNTFWQQGYLDPDFPWMRSFDAVVALCLVFTTIVTPYEVALLQTAFNPRFFINCLIDLVYFIDMMRSFFTAFFDNKTNCLVTSGRRIFLHYIRSWFIIDFVSVLPFDALSLAYGESFQKLKAIKIIRLLRLLKLAKIFRSLEFYDRYKSKVAIPLNVVSLFQNCLKMLICSHWMACAWILTATLQCDEECMDEMYGNAPPSTWLRTVEEADNYRFGTYQQYLSGVYWAIATITSVGYGDVTATNSTERLVACVSLLVSGLLWASIIGDICGIIATLDVNGIEFRQMYDQINTMMLDLQAPYVDID